MRRASDASARLAARGTEILDDQVALARIAAPTGAEAHRATWIADRFRATHRPRAADAPTAAGLA